MKHETKNVGTGDLFINGIQVSSELSNEFQLKQKEDRIESSIKCRLLGYYHADGFFGLPEFKEYLENRCTVLFELKDKQTKEIVKYGWALIKKINISYPDNDVSVITVKLEIIK